MATGTDHDLVLMVDENQDDLYKHKVLANFYDSIVKVEMHISSMISSRLIQALYIIKFDFNFWL